MVQRIVVDTDMGVDDAAAVAWLVSQTDHDVELAAITTVWGNTTVECATDNAVALLDVLGHERVPVVAGAGAPLERKDRSGVGALVHGADGLWGTARGTDASRATHDVVSFYRDLATDGATLLALGPLTNLAATARAAPEALHRFERIVVLGGAKHHGSMTPVSETNFWHDPEAADLVLSSRLPVTLVTRDAHRAFVLTPSDLDRLAHAETKVARFLSEALTTYARVTQSFGEALNYPDVVAAVHAVDTAVATEIRPALVRIVCGSSGLTRGQSIVGISVNERLTMIDNGAAVQSLLEAALTDPSFDVRRAVAAMLEREAPNAQVVLGIDADLVRARFMRAMTRGRT